MIDQQLAEVSNLSIVIAIVLYVLALIGFAADLASTSQRRSDERLAEQDRKALRRQELAAVGASTGTAGSAGSLSADAPADALRDASSTSTGGASSAAESSMSPQTFGFLLASAGVVLHVAGVVMRAIATQRVPWANMYEFATTSSAVVMLAFLVFAIRRADLRAIGTFVVGPVLLLMLLAQTFWIVPAAELTPSLQNSHWLYIHIAVAILATALSVLGAVIAGLQLASARHEKVLAQRMAAGEEDPEHWGRIGHVIDRLPHSKELEALSFRIHSVAFVCWTFTLMFGAIWARDAWGRYWGWDPKEVWTFIIWVVYAAYLHARATGGFRGSRAAWLALAGFLCVVFNYTIVNTVINGLHSYSGL
ncbi:c-type cytochrome biogenesis protein CcsB [Brachybacterium sp. DNPG3]